MSGVGDRGLGAGDRGGDRGAIGGWVRAIAVFVRAIGGRSGGDHALTLTQVDGDSGVGRSASIGLGIDLSIPWTLIRHC